MTVHHHVDVVFFEHAQVDLAGHRGGAAEHDVLEVGGDHGAGPAVGQGTAGGLFDQVVVVLVHPHVGAVHQLPHLDVHPPGHHPKPVDCGSETCIIGSCHEKRKILKI